MPSLSRDLFLASDFGVNLSVLQEVAQVLGPCDQFIPRTCEPGLECAVLLQLCSEPFVVYLILAPIRENTYKTDVNGYGGNLPGRLVWYANISNYKVDPQTPRAQRQRM